MSGSTNGLMRWKTESLFSTVAPRTNDGEIVVTLAVVVVEFLSLLDVPPHQRRSERTGKLRILVNLVEDEVFRLGDEPLLRFVRINVEQPVVDRIRVRQQDVSWTLDDGIPR